MSIELLNKPRVEVQNGVTHHILAIETSDEIEVDPAPTKNRVRAIGSVAITPSTMARYFETYDTEPFLIHDTMLVQGIVGNKLVYDKTVSPKTALGGSIPFYGLRISFAKMRAAQRVKSILSE